MLQFLFPANVSSLYSLILPVVTFDIIDPAWSTKFLFDFDEPKQEELKESVFDPMEDLGYETHNSLLNLGSLAVFSFFYYLRVLYYWVIVVPCAKKKKKCLKSRKSLRKQLFFGEIIYLSLSSYIVFLISALLNLDA